GHRWVALLGHRWVALLGTCRWHFWAQVGGTAEWHRWVHCWAQVGALLGTGGSTAGHGSGQLAGVHCWAPIIRALIISALMIGADPALTTAGSRHYFPHDLTA
ncbi:unnamed protein product, partial [Staurois parvus]